MKRAKYEEKIMGPMFPRLHVNDTERGGPRAPPRNKMALYEQLTIPSQRYNSGAVPNPTKSSLVSSSSQGSGHEKNTYFPLYRSPSTPTDPTNNLPVHHSDVENLSSMAVQAHRRKKPLDDDDFRVPTFSQSETDKHYKNGTINTHGGSRHSVCSKLPAIPSLTVGKETSQNHNVNHSSRQGVRNSEGINSNEFPSRCGRTDKPNSRSSLRQMIGGPLIPDDAANHECHERNILSRIQEHSLRSRRDCEPILPPREPSAGGAYTHKESFKSKLNSSETQGYRVTDEIDKSSQNKLEKHGSLIQENVSRGYDVSESLAESRSSFDISPDDVVGIMGLKHFWKARRAIADQQRVFAVQVFELHRLIKVQRLIAGSPHILLESGAYVGKPSLKSSPMKPLKPPPSRHNRTDDSQKSDHGIEGSAENAVGKASSSPPQNAAQPPIEEPFSGTTPSSLVKTDTKVNSLFFPQASGHQWLIPVMSPSEGLIYKPYPAAGFTGPACGGGSGPLTPIPMMGNFMNSGYGVPGPPHYPQGAGLAPGVPFNGQGYFPPYGMPVMNPTMSGSGVDQVNQLPGSIPKSQTVQPPRDGPKRSFVQQSQKNGSGSGAVKMPASKNSELGGSTASSPGVSRAQGVRMDPTSEGREALALFLPGPDSQVSARAADSQERGQTTRVIRVVPHNSVSASESANRIFQSIQHERQHQESN